jgi:hypothetical protein
MKLSSAAFIQLSDRQKNMEQWWNDSQEKAEFLSQCHYMSMYHKSNLDWTGIKALPQQRETGD